MLHLGACYSKPEKLLTFESMKRLLKRLLSGKSRKKTAEVACLPQAEFTDADVIITPNEVNERYRPS